MRERLAGGGWGWGWGWSPDENNTGWPRLQEREEQGQPSCQQTRWSHESQRRILGNVSGHKRGCFHVHEHRGRGMQLQLHRAGFHAAYCISGEALQIPSANINAALASPLPAAQRDVQKACSAIIQALFFPSAHSDTDKIPTRAAGTNRTSGKAN